MNSPGVQTPGSFNWIVTLASLWLKESLLLEDGIRLLDLEES